MSRLLARRIRLLSKMLKLFCIAGAILYPLLTFVYWVFDGPQMKFLKKGHWYIQFSDIPPIPSGVLSFPMKMVGFFIDFIPCIFSISILIILTILFGHYERLVFFSKSNIRRIRQIALLLFCKELISPFYLMLRNHVFTPSGQKYIAPLLWHSEFKTFLVVFGIFLLSYIMETVLYLEEDLIGTI